MIRYLIVPLIGVFLLAIYNIIKKLPESLRISSEKKRREAEHYEYMMAYNTRRQLYGEVYSVSRRYNLSGNEDKQSQEHLSNCTEDDEAEIKYDNSKAKYAVSCSGNFIGYMPPAANSVLSKISDYKAIITALGFTKSDKYFAQVTIYSNE